MFLLERIMRHCFALPTIIGLALLCANPAAVHAQDKKLVKLSCKVSDEWADRMVTASTRVPKPTRQEIIDKFKNEGKIYEIEVSFTDDEQPLGVGSFMGQEVGYLKAESAVMFWLNGKPGGEKLPSATLDRFSGQLIWENPNSLTVEYICARQNRKF